MKSLPVSQLLKPFNHLPRFSDGRIDYSQASKAPVLTCFVTYNKKILLLKRSSRVRTYPGKWQTVAGYIDEPIPLITKAKEELFEELGIAAKQITQLVISTPYEFFDPSIEKTWLIHPAVALLKKQVRITLDWEHTAYQWVNPDEVTVFDIVPNLVESLKRIYTFI